VMLLRCDSQENLERPGVGIFSSVMSNRAIIDRVAKLFDGEL